MRQRLTIVFLALVVSLAAILVMAGCAGEPATTGRIHCELRTEDDGARMYWVTETGDLDLTLLVSTQGTGLTELLFGLFVDGRQWPATWDGRQAMVFVATVQPNSSREIQFCVRGLPRGVHALHLLSTVLPGCDRDLTEDHIMSDPFPIDMNPFTVESRSPIEASPDQVAAATTQGPAVNVLQAVDKDGVLCVDPNTLAIDPSFDIRDRQTLFYVWRNESDNPVQARFVLLVDWIQRPWPNQQAVALEVRAQPNEVVVEEIDLSGLPIGDTSYVAVIAFLQPLRPAWLLDDSGHTDTDPEGGQAFGSNYVVVLGR